MILIRALFDAKPLFRPFRLNSLFSCSKYVFCRKGYFKPAQEVVLQRKGRTMIWIYNHHFSCKNLLYFLTSQWDAEFYLRKAKNDGNERPSIIQMLKVHRTSQNRMNVSATHRKYPIWRNTRH